MECGIIKKIREAEGEREQEATVRQKEQLEGGELAGSHRGGNDTQKNHNQICVITVITQRRKENQRKIKEVFDMPQPSRSLCLNIPSISTTKPLLRNTTTHYGPPNIAPACAVSHHLFMQETGRMLIHPKALQYCGSDALRQKYRCEKNPACAHFLALN